MEVNLNIFFNNKKYLSNNEKCGCVKCFKLFAANDIRHWTDQGITALCPFCNTDLVISEITFHDLDEDMIKKINNIIFN